MFIPRSLLLMFCCHGMAAIADDSPLLGEPVDADTLARIDYTIMPDGDGLPEGSGTARDGAPVMHSTV